MKKLLLVILCFAIFMGIGSCLVSVVETGEKGNNSITDKDETSSNFLFSVISAMDFLLNYTSVRQPQS